VIHARMVGHLELAVDAALACHDDAPDALHLAGPVRVQAIWGSMDPWPTIAGSASPHS
jgi:hypothetical protein